MSEEVPREEVEPEAPAAPAIGPETIAYLEERALQSFERQLDIEESVWRSMPFFTGALIGASTMLGYAAARLPQPQWSPYSVATHLLVMLGVLAFAWSFRWLWEVARPRDYEYPADDEAVADYAEQMNAFHAASGAEAGDLDKIVTVELRTFMARQLGDAARRNFRNNQARLSARSQVLLFLALGFALAFAGECIIFVHGIVTTVHEGARDSAAASKQPGSTAPDPAVAPAVTAAGADRPRRRVVQQDELDTADQKQVMAEDKKPPAPPAQAPRRPEPPRPQLLKKSEDTPLQRK